MAKLTRRFFEMMAKAIKEEPSEETRKRLSKKQGEVLEQTNKSFSWAIWRDACDVKTPHPITKASAFKTQSLGGKLKEVLEKNNR